MKVLYITYDGLTDPLGQSQILPYVIGLSNKGYEFTILSCDKPKPFKKNKELINRICNQHNIRWESVTYSNQLPVLSAFWNVIKLNRRAKKLFKKNKFKITHCRSYIPAITGLSLKQKNKVQFIFDMRGFWADERVEGGLWTLSNPVLKKIYHYFKSKEIQFINQADKIVSLTETGKNEILSWKKINISPNKIHVIPCAADFNLFSLNSVEQHKKAKQKLGLTPSTFVLSYIGSIGTWYLLDEMLCFFKHLKEKKQDVKFLFLTADDKQVIYNSAQKHNLSPDDFIIQFSPRAELPQYAYASDLSIFFIKPSFSKKASSPTKMGELMAMGIPIICNNNVGDVEAIIDQTQAGYCLNEFTPESYQFAIDQIQQLSQIPPSAIRNSSMQFYDLEKGISLYHNVYKELST